MFSFAENIFCQGKKFFFSDFSVFMEPENGKTESVNENENKENKNVHMSLKNTFCNKNRRTQK